MWSKLAGVWMSKSVHLKEDGDCRDLLGVCLVAMAEVTAVGQI